MNLETRNQQSRRGMNQSALRYKLTISQETILLAGQKKIATQRRRYVHGTAVSKTI